MPVGTLVQRVSGDLRRAWLALLLYEIAFHTLAIVLAAPLVAWTVSALVTMSGSAAVSNTAIARFLLTPAGLAATVVLASGTLLGELLFSAGLMTIGAMALAGKPVSASQAIATAARSSLRLLGFGVVSLVKVAIVFAPFLGMAALTYWLLLTSHDINYYLAERPPAFVAAAAIGALLAAGLLAILAVFAIRFLFVLPAMLFESSSIRSAFRASRMLVAGAAWRLGTIVLSWYAFLALLAPLVGRLYAAAGSRLMDHAGSSTVLSVLLVAVLLAGHALLVAVLAFLQIAGVCLLMVRLYDERSGGRARAWAESAATFSPRSTRLKKWAWALGTIGAGAGLIGSAAVLVHDLRAARPVGVTAHRGASRAAPENTMAAIRAAIAQGADYAEIDVHLTADGVPVLVHDEDLKRLAGIARRPGAMTLQEIRQVDVGTQFSPAFAGEPIPTLAEVLDAARGRIKLNVELKPAGGDRNQLARAVAELLRTQAFERECFVTSLDSQAVAIARRHDPLLRSGTIVSAAVGDVSQLDVDVLSVRTGLITPALLGRAHAAGKEVHAWTVDDPGVMAELIDRGVDNLITNDPAVAVRVRRERQELPSWQRMILGLRSRLAGW
jgi:glycerophosphoryl diester phosphodiesterase